jgi:hypothetical protein
VNRCGKIWLLASLLAGSAVAQPADPNLMGKEIDALLKEYQAKGKKSFETRWPGGALKEKLEADKAGNVNYTLFFPTGGYAVRYQCKPGTVTKLERYFGNGKTHILINQDPRIIDYTSYWENGNKKAKYQKNLQTKQVFYDARDAEGKPIYPRPKP